MRRFVGGLLSVAVFVLLPMLGTALVTWWALGDAFSSPTGRDKVMSLPVAEENSLALGAAGIALGTYYGVRALQFGWVHTRCVPPAQLRSARVVVALDEDSEKWLAYNCAKKDVRRLTSLRNLFGERSYEESAKQLEEIAAAAQRVGA